MNCEGTLEAAEWAACVQASLEPVMAAVTIVVAVSIGLAVMIAAAMWARRAIRMV